MNQLGYILRLTLCIITRCALGSGAILGAALVFINSTAILLPVTRAEVSMPLLGLFTLTLFAAACGTVAGGVHMPTTQPGGIRG